MSVFESLARFAAARRMARAQRETQQMLNALPLEIQKDIGWGGGGHARASRTASLHGWGGPGQ